MILNQVITIYYIIDIQNDEDNGIWGLQFDVPNYSANSISSGKNKSTISATDSK